MPKIRFFLAALLVALPWLNPFVPNPSPTVVPWLVSLGCAGTLLLVVPGRKPPQWGGWVFMIFCGFFLLHWRLQGGRYGAELMGMLAALTVFWGSVTAGLGMVNIEFQCRAEGGNTPHIPHQSLSWLAFTWLAVALISCTFGLLQYFGWAESLRPWVNQPLHLGEAFANLRQRNQFATLTSIGLVALLGILLQPGWLGRNAPAPETRFPKWAYGAMALLALGNAASGSRTGLLEWLLLLACTVWWNWPARRFVAVFAVQTIIVYFLAVVALPWVFQIFNGVAVDGVFDRITNSEGCLSRKILWSNVVMLILEKPWFGWGWGGLDYAHFIGFFPSSRFCQIVDNAHNLPLHLAVEFGIPAALMICSFIMWLVWNSKPWREVDHVRQMIWGVLAVIMLHSLLEFPLWYGAFQITFGLCVGILWGGSGKFSMSGLVVSAKKIENIKQALEYRMQKFTVVLAVLCLVMMVAGGASYYHVRQIYIPLGQRDYDYRDDTLSKVQSTLLFPDQARFALLMSVGVVNSGNAQEVYLLAKELMYYSPEAPVVEKLIDSAIILGRDEEVKIYKSRFLVAFPGDYAKWILKIGGKKSVE